MFFVSICEARPEQLRELVGRDVGRDRRLERLDELGEARDEVLRVGLLAEREQDALLAGAAVEVVRAVARAGVAERLGAVHVLDPARDVDRRRRPSSTGIAVVETGTWTLMVTPPIASTTCLKPSKLTSTKYLMSSP